MSAPASIRPEAVHSHVIVLVDPEVESLERQVARFADSYRRRLWPALIASASILGVIIAVAQLMKWIDR